MQIIASPTPVVSIRESEKQTLIQNTFRIVVSNPNCNPNSLNFAQAFAERGLLARFATTIADRPERLWQKLACVAGKLAGLDMANQFRRRSTGDLPANLVIDRPWRELIRLGISRMDRSGVLSDNVWEWAELGFDRWASKHALKDAVAVVGGEHACRETFRSARNAGLFCVYDLWAPQPDFTARILEAEAEKFGELRTDYHRHIMKPERVKRRAERRREEWDFSNLIVANSQFTKDSFAGYQNPEQPKEGLGKIEVVPLGAPPVDESGIDGGTKDCGPMRFLYAGSFSIRKGCHYLVKAWNAANTDPSSALLIVCGGITVPCSVSNSIKGGVTFLGSVDKTTLFENYKSSDVLLFPTLCDGFGMVVTEALSRGLPVITTRRAGASDLIRHKENGLLVEAGDPAGLLEAITWCLDNRKRLRDMRAEALKTAGAWQWSDYRAKLVETILKRYSESGAKKRSLIVFK